MANWVRRCFDCGYPLARRVRFCPRCGARQRPERLRRRATRTIEVFHTET